MGVLWDLVPGAPPKIKERRDFVNRPAKKMHSRLDRHLMGIGILFLLPAAILITFTTLVPIVWNGV